MRLFGIGKVIVIRSYVSLKRRSRELGEIVGDKRICISAYLGHHGIEITVVPGVRRAGASKACQADASSTRNTLAAAQQSQRWAQSDTLAAHSDVNAFEVVIQGGEVETGRTVSVFEVKRFPTVFFVWLVIK